jgi:hypothetical protein
MTAISKKMPPAGLPVVDPKDGRINPQWYVFFKTFSSSALTGVGVTGMVVSDGSDLIGRTLTGSNYITVTNGSGVSAAPDISFSASYPGQNTITTLGTVTTGTWNASSISTSYTDAKLKTLTGTAARITVGGTSTDPTVDISATYVGQATITTLGTVSTGVWNGSSISTTYTDAKLKSLTGTANRVTIGGTATDPTVDISASYVGQSSITTLGTIITGTWNGTQIANSYLANSAVANLSGTNTGDQNLFSTIAVSGQSNVVADSTTDTLTLIAGSNIIITTNATTDSITIASTASGTSSFSRTFALMGS